MKYYSRDVIAKALDNLKDEISLLETEIDKMEKGYDYLKTMRDREPERFSEVYGRTYAVTQRNLSKLKSRLKKLNALKLEPAIFNYIVGAYINRMVIECIDEAYELNLGFNLGIVKLVKVKRVRPRIDWKASLENKEKLLERGVKLWDKETGTGEKWFVYHNDKYNYPFKWLKFGRNFKYSYGWYFKFTKGPNGIGTLAITRIRDNPSISLKHKLHEKRKD